MSNNEKQTRISSFSFEAVIIYMSRSYAGFYEIIAILFNKKLLPWQQLSCYLWDYSKEGQWRKGFVLERMLIWPSGYKQCFVWPPLAAGLPAAQLQSQLKVLKHRILLGKQKSWWITARICPANTVLMPCQDGNQIFGMKWRFQPVKIWED